MLYSCKNCIRLSFALSKNYDSLDKFIGNLEYFNSTGGASSFYSIYKNVIHSFILHYLTFKKLQKALNLVKI